MLLRIEHETRLLYSEAVAEHVVELRMGPQSDDDQTTLGYRLHVQPVVPITAYRDHHGNRVDLFNVLPACREIVVRALSYVRTHRRSGAARLDGVCWDPKGSAPLEAIEFLQTSPLLGRSTELESFVGALPPPRPGLLGIEIELLMKAVRERLRYEKKATTARTPLDEALRLGCGVCQDFAHLFLGACRLRGLPGRYVSGYIHQEGELATHAWCQVHGGAGAGWLDVDPTHGSLPAHEHVVTAVGRDYSDVPPNRGVWKGAAEESMAVLVTVAPAVRLPSDWIDFDESRPRRPLPFVSTRRVAGATGLSHQIQNRSPLRQQQNQQQQQVASRSIKP